MAKYKVEYVKDISEQDGFWQVVQLRRMNAQHQDFIANNHFISDNHHANSKCINVNRQCTAWLKENNNTKIEQYLLDLCDMIIHLIATEKPTASKRIDFDATQELILTPEKEQEIERIYAFAKDNALENLKQLQTHGLFKAHENLDEKKEDNHTAGMKI